MLGCVGLCHFAPGDKWMDVLAHLLELKPGTVVDVGANLGQTLLALLRSRRRHLTSLSSQIPRAATILSTCDD